MTAKFVGLTPSSRLASGVLKLLVTLPVPLVLANLFTGRTTQTRHPIVDVTNARREMQLKSGGYKPNCMVVGKEVRDILVNHPDILARLNGGATVSNTALITDAKLAEIFEVEQFLVMEAVYNDAAEGLTDNIEFIGGKHAMLAYKPSSMGLKTPASGAIFTWDALPRC